MVKSEPNYTSVQAGRAGVGDGVRSTPIAHNIVVRKRIFDALNARRTTPVLLVCAPAGYGKSLAVASWLDAGDLPSPTWVNVGFAKTSATSLWGAITETLARESDDDAPALREIMSLAARAPGEVPARLAGWVRRRPCPTVLVLDDLHGVTGSELHEQLLEFIAAAAPSLHLVALSRHDPPWPLHRMRLEGVLIDLRADAIRFDRDEAAELFGMLGISLDPPDVDLVVDRTEGWAAGLRLAALGLTSAPDAHDFVAHLSERSGYIADYLMREVYQRLPAQWRDFLGHVSVVDEVCPELGDALGQRANSAVLLAELSRLNAFVQDLGNHGGWYRIHPLLLDFLRSHMTDEKHRKLLHRRASRWFRDQGEYFRSLRHAIAGEDWSAAAGLVGAHIITWAVREPPLELAALLEQVPNETVLTHPGLAIGVAAVRGMSGRTDGVAQLVAAARSQVHRVTGRTRRRYEFLLELIGFGDHRWTGDLEAMLAGCSQVPIDPATLSSLGLSDWTAVRPLILSNMGMAELWLGDRDAARLHLEEAAASDVGPRVLLPSLNARAHLSHLHWAAGDLAVASKLAEDAVAQAVNAGIPRAVQATAAYLTLAGVAVDRAEHDDAEAWLDLAAECCMESQSALSLTTLRARVLHARGRSHEAVTMLREALEEAGPRPPGPLVDEAQRWERRIRGAEESDVTATIEPAEPGATVRDRLGRHLRATLAPNDSHDDQLDALEHALSAAAGEELRGPFLDHETELRSLLAERIERGTAHTEFAADLLSRMSNPQRTASRRFAPFAPLSEREINVLKYLTSSMTTAEIADALYISVNTVKTHQRAIYQKLGARGRREAVARAHELNIL